MRYTFISTTGETFPIDRDITEDAYQDACLLGQGRLMLGGTKVRDVPEQGLPRPMNDPRHTHHVYHEGGLKTGK